MLRAKRLPTHLIASPSLLRQADDNGSGTSAVMELLEALKDLPHIRFHRTILFALFSGEEQGASEQTLYLHVLSPCSQLAHVGCVEQNPSFTLAPLLYSSCCLLALLSFTLSLIFRMFFSFTLSPCSQLAHVSDTISNFLFGLYLFLFQNLLRIWVCSLLIGLLK